MHTKTTSSHSQIREADVTSAPLAASGYGSYSFLSSCKVCARAYTHTRFSCLRMLGSRCSANSSATMVSEALLIDFLWSEKERVSTALGWLYEFLFVFIFFMIRVRVCVRARVQRKNFFFYRKSYFRYNGEMFSTSRTEAKEEAGTKCCAASFFAAPGQFRRQKWVRPLRGAEWDKVGDWPQLSDLVLRGHSVSLRPRNNKRPPETSCSWGWK